MIVREGGDRRVWLQGREPALVVWDIGYVVLSKRSRGCGIGYGLWGEDRSGRLGGRMKGSIRGRGFVIVFGNLEGLA